MRMNALLNVVARNTTAGMLAQVLIKVLSFAFTVIVIRRLGVETYGQYAAVMAFGAVFVFLADLGLGPWLVRETAHVRDETDGRVRVEGLLGNVSVLRTLLAVAAVALILLTGWLTGRPPAMMLGLLLGGLGLILYGAEGGFEAVLTGHERLDVIAAGRVIQQVGFVLLGALVLYAGLPYHALIVANLVGILLLSVVVWRGVRDLGLRGERAQPAQWGGLLRAAMPFGAVSLALGLSYRFDTVLLNVTQGDDATGVYNAAYTLVFAVVVISNVINTSLYPTLTRQAHAAPGTLPAIYSRAFKGLLVISLPLAAGGWALADGLTHLLYGAQYAGTAWVLQIVIWVVPLMFISEFLGYVVLIGRREQNVARAVVISSLANVAGNLILIPLYGIAAAARMTVVTEAVLVGQYVWLLRGELRAMRVGGTLLRVAAAATMMTAVTLLLRAWVPVLLNVAISALVYAGALLLMGVVTRGELAVLRTVRMSRPQTTAERSLETAVQAGPTGLQASAELSLSPSLPTTSSKGPVAGRSPAP